MLKTTNKYIVTKGNILKEYVNILFFISIFIFFETQNKMLTKMSELLFIIPQNEWWFIQLKKYYKSSLYLYSTHDMFWAWLYK